jgi:hypothetical protein
VVGQTRIGPLPVDGDDRADARRAPPAIRRVLQTAPTHDAATFDTPHAGVILLWRSVRALGLEALFPSDAEPGHAALTLAATLAGPACAAAWRDPALHWLAGFAPARRDRPLKADPGMAERFTSLLVERATPRRIAPVVQRQAGLRVDQDGATEDWLALKPERGPSILRPPMRPPACDMAFFGVVRSPRRRPWALLARAAYGDFARRLNGLDRSSAAWLWPNVLAGWGRVEPGPVALLEMPRVPLDLVLRMTGLDGSGFILADGRRVKLCLRGND